LWTASLSSETLFVFFLSSSTVLTTRPEAQRSFSHQISNAHVSKNKTSSMVIQHPARSRRISSSTSSRACGDDARVV
jgi:hypothetical protein